MTAPICTDPATVRAAHRLLEWLFRPEAGGVKTRRHHNNKGYRRTKRGKRAAEVGAMAKRLGLKYARPRWRAE